MMMGLSSERTAAKHVSYHGMAKIGSLTYPPHVRELTAYLLSLTPDTCPTFASLSYVMNDKSSVKPPRKYRYNP